MDNNQVSNLVTALRRETNNQITENGALAYRTTESALLDFFGVAGALRNRNSKDIIDKFTKAFIEDKLLATKMLFYTRDIREGLGERSTFKTILTFLAKNYPDIVKKNLELVPFYGRWDDLYILFGTPLEKDVINLFNKTLQDDLKKMNEGKPVSLLAKWLKSTSGVSKQTERLGKLTAKGLKLTYKEYRKTLSSLRNYIDIVETKMTSNQWDSINYENVPSIAMKNYKNAFERHSPSNFSEYVENVKSGKAKINANVLYPYNILESAGLEIPWRGNLSLEKWDEALEQQWKALPNYIEGDNNILVMADTSGSMEGRPMASALGLAIYFAEKNKGIWHNKFLTFSRIPELVELNGENLKEKVSCVRSIVANTNIEAAFDLVLESAIKYNLSQEQLPKAIIIISDMEFDDASGNYNYYYNSINDRINSKNKIMDELARRYTAAGYIIPRIVYWNVNSRQDTYHATSDYKNVAMVSGHSVSTFKNILNAIDEDPYQTMLSILENERYDLIKV